MRDEPITNCDNVIDSRTIIKRIEELKDGFTIDLDDVDDVIRMAEFDKDEMQELVDLLRLQDDAEDYCEWRDGATLIHNQHFVEYVEQFARDTGAVSDNSPWPINHVDWEAAADELRPAYVTVEFAGVDYYVRSS